MSRLASALECFAGSVVPDGWSITPQLYAELARMLGACEEERELEALNARCEAEESGERAEEFELPWDA